MKINTDDLHFEMMNKLIELSIKKKAPHNRQEELRIIELCLREYTCEKLFEIVSPRDVMVENFQRDLAGLLTFMDAQIEEEVEKRKVFNNYTHYLLGSAKRIHNIQVGVSAFDKKQTSPLNIALISLDIFEKGLELETPKQLKKE